MLEEVAKAIVIGIASIIISLAVGYIVSSAINVFIQWGVKKDKKRKGE